MLLPTLANAQDTVHDRTACTSVWSQPEPLRNAEGRLVYVAEPITSPGDTAAIAVGIPALILASTDTSTRASSPPFWNPAALLGHWRRNRYLLGVLATPSGAITPLRAPGIVTPRMQSPRPVVDESGVVHLVWAETDKETSQAARATTLWHSVLKSGSWSRPELIATADNLYWSSYSGAVLVSGRDLLVLVLVQNQESGMAVLLLRRSAKGWSPIGSPLEGLPSQLTAVVTRDSSIVATYAATDPRAGVRNGTHVYAIRAKLKEGNYAWDSPGRIAWSGVNAARYPFLSRLVDPSGTTETLVLVWGLATRGVLIDTLRAAVSADGGGAWRDGGSLRTPRSLYLQGTASSTSVHLITVSDASEQGRSLHAIWHPQGWKPISASPVGRVRNRPSVVFLNDQLLLFWADQPSSGPSNVPITWLSSIRNPC